MLLEPPAPKRSGFQCSSIASFVGLQLAQRLDDVAHLEEFVRAAENGTDRLFGALQRISLSTSAGSMDTLRDQLTASALYEPT